MSPELQNLEAAIAALEAQRALLGDDVVDASIPALRAKIAALRAAAPAAGTEQALKQVSILFLDLVGSTALSQRLDPEEVGAVMDGALARATTVVTGHRGRVLQYAGDNLLAVFGADESHEDDAECAVLAGLALLALGHALAAEVEAAHRHRGFDLRVGIHTGGVLLGGGVDEGDSIRGIAVNIAARMEQTAPAGTLRISQDTYHQVRGVFDVEPQEPMAIKGVDAPVVSYFVTRAKPRAFRVERRGIEGVATRMIGRDAEFEILQDAFKRLVRPVAGVERVVVVAEPGVGKSRLLYEFRNWAEARPERYVVFQARSTPQTLGQPYGMLRDLLAWRFQIADGDAMDVARRKLEDGLAPLFAAGDEAEAVASTHLLGQLIGLDYHDSPHVRGIRDDGRQIRNRGFHAAAQVFRRIGGPEARPTIVYLEDLHWADDGSLDFFDYLVQVDRDVPMLIVALSRPTLFERREDLAATYVQRIDLHPLDRTGSRLLANELLKRLPEIPAALRELITGGADGNPFYMEELVRMLIDQRAIETGETWSVHAEKLLSLTVPPTLAGVLQARLDGLPPPERHALQLASVIGVHFWDAALAHVQDDAAEQLPALSQRDLVTAKERDAADDVREYAFHHQILHQVTYDTVLKRVKRDAHAKTAQWLAEQSGMRKKGLLGSAAEHFERAGDPASAAEFYARAAEHTASTFANEAALDYTARALALVADDALDLRWRLVANRERTLDLLGRRSEQMHDVETLLAVAERMDDDARRAEAAWRRCDIAARTGDYPTQRREAARALALAERLGLDDLTFRAIQRLATATAFTGDPAAGRALAEAGLKRAQDGGLLSAQMRLCNAITLCAERQSDLVAMLRNDTLGLSIARQIGDRRAEALMLSNVGAVCTTLGDHPQARRCLDEALKINRAIGNRALEGTNLNGLSELAWRAGDDALALTHAQAGIAIQNEVGSKIHLCDALRNLGNAELALGRYPQAIVAFEQSCENARAIDQRLQVLNALNGLMMVAIARDDAAEATAAASRLLAECGLDPATAIGEADHAGGNPFSGACEHAIRLNLHRVWSWTHDPRADAALDAAHRALQAQLDGISDPALREGFVGHIAEHREIMARSAARRSTR